MRRESVQNPKPPTEKEIVQEFIRMVLKERTNNKIYPNVFIGDFEADLFEVTKSGVCVEYEVKLTKADFNNDKHKSKHGVLKHDIVKSGNRINKLYYVVPKDLEVDVPEYAGLITFDRYILKYCSEELGYIEKEKTVFKKVKSAPFLTMSKFDYSDKLTQSVYYRFLNFFIKD